MIRKVHHLGIAVRDVQQALQDLGKALGVPPGGTEEVPSQKVRVGFMQLGEVRIEFLEPLGEDSTIAKFLASRGEGFHHMALETDDIEGDLAKAESAGLVLIDRSPRQGAHGTKVAFIHPKSVHGVLVELVQP